MLKEAILIVFALVAVSLAYPAEEGVDAQPKAFVDQEPIEQEALEGAESANPQWGWGGRRGWGGGGWGGRGGWGGGGWGGRGWGGGGWGGGGWGGGGWGRRGGWGWGK